jgi:hypothetical protein
MRGCGGFLLLSLVAIGAPVSDSARSVACPRKVVAELRLGLHPTLHLRGGGGGGGGGGGDPGQDRRKDPHGKDVLETDEEEERRPSGAEDLARMIREMLDKDVSITVEISKWERSAYMPPTDEVGAPVNAGYDEMVESLERKFGEQGASLVALSKELAGRDEIGSRLAWEMMKLGVEK